MWLWLACGTAEQAPQEPEPLVEQAPPDVLFIVVDTLRADRLGVYGHERPTSPFIDSLAAEGVVFTDATMPATWTWPGHAALFSGEPPWVSGAHHASGDNTGMKKSVKGIRGDLKTFAERFGGAGYATLCIGGNNLLSPEFGLVRGFQMVAASISDDLVLERVQQVASVRSNDKPTLLFVNLMSAHAPYPETDAPWITDEERGWWTDGPDWLREYHNTRNGGPVLQFVRTPGFGPDHPRVDGSVYEVPPHGVDFIGRVYDSGVLRADGYVEDIVTAWRETHPDGIVVVTSDHGEYLGEHDLLVHHATVYRPVTWVPLIVSWPGHLEPAVIDTPISVERIGPTILDYAGIEGGTQRSLRPVIEGGDTGEPAIQAKAWVDEHRRSRYAGIFQYEWTQYRVGDLAYVASTGGHHELYDLSSDPLMLVDLAADLGDDVTRLQAASADAFQESSGAEVDGDMQSALEALGYLE